MTICAFSGSQYCPYLVNILCYACFPEYFCSGVIRQHSACGACAHTLCILNGIKVCTAQSISIYHRTTCMFWSDRERTNIRWSHVFTHISVVQLRSDWGDNWNFMYTQWVLSPSYDNCQLFFSPPLGITLLFHSPTTAHTHMNLISPHESLGEYSDKKSFLWFWCWCTNTDLSPPGQSSTWPAILIRLMNNALKQITFHPPCYCYGSD